MRPTGWFQVAWSADLEVGDVKALHYFGEDLVAFRDLNGLVRVLDAHCRHLGADLSHGGCVVEGGIQCPLHGWVWSGADGRNVHIPYEQCPVDDRKVGCWATTERNECIYIWNGIKQSHPLWPVPDIYQELDGPVGRHYCASAVDRREHRRCTALPVRTSCPPEPDRPGRGVEHLDVARQVSVRWRRSC
jgi:phenylpropionate dioxygenase-like ring-hydroxylating dioxygenase large terminal subunit